MPRPRWSRNVPGRRGAGPPRSSSLWWQYAPVPCVICTWHLPLRRHPQHRRGRRLLWPKVDSASEAPAVEPAHGGARLIEHKSRSMDDENQHHLPAFAAGLAVASWIWRRERGRLVATSICGAQSQRYISPRAGQCCSGSLRKCCRLQARRRARPEWRLDKKVRPVKPGSQGCTGRCVCGGLRVLSIPSLFPPATVMGHAMLIR